MLKNLQAHLLLIFLFFTATLFGQKAKDGTQNFSPGAATTYIFNRYDALNATASVGATSVTVTNIANLSGATAFANSFNSFATAALAPGDLVMIIKVQGSTIATTDDANWTNDQPLYTLNPTLIILNFHSFQSFHFITLSYFYKVIPRLSPF